MTDLRAPVARPADPGSAKTGFVASLRHKRPRREPLGYLRKVGDCCDLRRAAADGCHHTADDILNRIFRFVLGSE
jgi:hypothetical protein